jgi:transmembrane sensor
MGADPRLSLLFSKYLQRHCTPEEVVELIGLLQEADASETLSGPMQALWEQVKGENTEYDVDWDKMYAVVSNTEGDLITLNRRRNRNLRRARFRLVAASILALTVLSAAWWALRSGRAEGAGPVLASSAGGNSVVHPNKKQIIHLPDGSTVILNNNSKLNYPAVFAGNTREVYLSGEGYFEIIRNTGKPFLVHTGKITTRVLGTDFNIRAYPADGAIEVTVTQGRVQVLRENKSMGLLTADQQISFSTSTDQYAQKKVDTRPVVAWKPDEISFDDITMLEATRRIGDRFKMNVEFVNPAITNCRVTATFYEDDALNEIMTVICGVSQSNFTIVNNKIIIDGKGCN